MATNKLRRNDPWHCGSGKKYKKCCLVSTVSPSSGLEITDLEWRKLRQLEGRVFDKHLIPYVTQTLPDDVMTQAIIDCLPEDLPENLDKELLFTCFFLPWSLFHWIPFDTFGLDNFKPELTLSQNYVLSHETALNSRERRFIEAMNRTYYSFYSVLDVELDKALRVKDILLGTTHTLKEHQGTYYLKRGDVVYARILTLDNQSIFVGMAPITIPAVYHHDVLDFKKWLMEEENEGNTLTAENLRDEFAFVLLEYFFEILESAYNKPLPTLFNTDGELLQFSKSHFKLAVPPEDALKKILPMTLSKDSDEFLALAERDDSGRIQRIECPWLKKGNKKHKSWDNTVLDYITIEPDRLLIDTNSEERTIRAKKQLTKCLGDAITFQQTLIESPEQKMQSLPAESTNPASQTELMALPEVQEQLKAMVQSHWEHWFDEPIPVLDHKTPREAAKTLVGREQLEALLLQYELHDAERNNLIFKADIDYLREELALD